MNSYVHNFTKLQIEFGIKDFVIDLLLDVLAPAEVAREGGGWEATFGFIFL